MTARDHDPSFYYEDLEVGMVLTSAGRTVTETDLVTFCMLSGDWNPIHADAEFSRETHFGERVVHGVFGISVLTGLMDRAGWFSTSAIAMLGIDEWRFRGPILVGDTVHCELEVSSLRRASRGDRGIVGRRFRLINQDGEVVQEGEIPMLVRTRGCMPRPSSGHGSTTRLRGGDMSEINQQSARVEALRGVVDRVTSWQETATEGTIHEELDRGLREAGLTLTEEQRDEVAHRIGEGQEIDVEALAADSEAGGPA